VHESQPSNYKFSSIVLAIVKSPSFQMNQKLAATSQGTLASR
jgi:hypothetical protein